MGKGLRSTPQQGNSQNSSNSTLTITPEPLHHSCLDNNMVGGPTREEVGDFFATQDRLIGPLELEIPGYKANEWWRVKSNDDDPQESTTPSKRTISPGIDFEEIDASNRNSSSKKKSKLSPSDFNSILRSSHSIPLDPSDDESSQEEFPQHPSPSSETKRALRGRKTIHPISMGPSTTDDYSEPDSPTLKRKFSNQCDLLPVPQQLQKVFAGLVFLIVPYVNTKLYALKKKGYEEAGARVTTDINDNISHYINLKNWNYIHVLQYIKSAAIRPGSVVVKDSWAAECIEHGKLIPTEGYDLEIPKEPVSEPAKVASVAVPVDKEPVVKPEESEELEKPKDNDPLAEYVLKATAHGIIEGYLSSEDEDEDEKRSLHKAEKKEQETLHSKSPSSAKKAKKASASSVLLTESPVQGSEQNANWRTIEIVCTVTIENDR